ncbi:MAG: hypothetical protein HY308_03815 [Gammaproteobacteria bacterium]|nr:hypothetical protein [Gammaproteobacteria bacterium]
MEKINARFSLRKALVSSVAIALWLPAEIVVGARPADDNMHATVDLMVAANNGGIGGTGAASIDGGIGGTGVTRSIGRTGVIGVVTDSKGVRVNGIDAVYNRNTPVTLDGKQVSSAELAAGQVVAIDAIGAGTQLQAMQIDISSAVVGPVESVSSAADRLQVLGQVVRLTQRTIFSAPTSKPRVGDTVRVYGLRQNDGSIIASRIDAAPTGSSTGVTGPVSAIDNDTIYVGALAIQRADHLLSSELQLGRVVHAVGIYNKGQLHAEQMSLPPFVERGKRIELEGYVQSRRSATDFLIGDLTIKISAHTLISGTDGTSTTLAEGQRVHVSGKVTATDHIDADQVAVEETPQ